MNEAISDESAREVMRKLFRDSLSDERARMALDLLTDEEEDKLINWNPGDWYYPDFWGEVPRMARQYEHSLSEHDLQSAALAWFEEYLNNPIVRDTPGAIAQFEVEKYHLEEFVECHNMILIHGWYYTPGLHEWNTINNAPYSMTDLSPLDDVGRKIMERVRREYRAPVERFSPGVWGDLHDWIDLQWAWCDEHDVDPVKFWGKFPGVEWAFDLVSFRPPTQAIVEHLIAECVAAYQQAHKREEERKAGAMVAMLEEVRAMHKEATEELKKINRDAAGRGGGSKRKSKCDKLKLSSAAAEAVYKAWHEYTSGTADCELPTKGKELRKTKRTYAECLEALGDKVVHHSKLEGKDYKLKELAPTPDTLKKIVNAGRMRKTRHPAPARNEKNAQMTHKRARK